MNLYQFFDEVTTKYHANLAFQIRPRYRTLRWTYGELRNQSAKMSQHLAELGIGRGDKVLLFAPNSPFWVAGFFAIISRGAIVVPLNTQSTPEQLNGIIKSSKAKLLVKSSRLPWLAKEISTLNLQSVMEQQPTEEPEVAFPSDPNLKDEDVAEIVYTSGTTGEPKGVMLTHQNLLSNMLSLSEAVQGGPTDHIVSIIPLFHMYGQMTSLFYPMQHGASVTFLPSLGSKLILETFRFTPATHLTAVPEFLKTLMDRMERQMDNRLLTRGLLRSSFVQHLSPTLQHTLLSPIRRRISKTLHTITSGGAPLDPELERKWRMLGFEVLQGYGLTETSPCISTNSPSASRIGSVGKPMPGIQVKISPDGELLVKGPNVTVGYFNDPVRTKALFDEEGWCKTDDGAKLDEDGFLYIFGRRKYTIMGSSGEKIFPEDIEAELNKHVAVKDCAVVGVVHDGHTVINAVILADSDNIAQAVEDANAHLAPHQQILAWSVWPEADFPRSATRKVKKEEIIKWLTGQKSAASLPKHDAITPLMRTLALVTKCDPRTLTQTTNIVTDLKLDSLRRIELVSQIEEDFGVSVEEKSITQKTTLADLEQLITAQRGKPPQIIRYPRWSQKKFFHAIRPALQDLFLFSWLKPLIKVNVEGAENLEGLQGPVLFMPNHVSYIDPSIFLQALPRAVRHNLGGAAAVNVLYTKFALTAPLADLFFNSFPFPTDEDENIKPGLEYTGRLLDDGTNVFIFPEGQLNHNPAQRMNHLKPGAGVIACEMNATIVPMAIIGLSTLIDLDHVFPHSRGSVRLLIGKPLRFSYTDSYTEATQKIECAIEELIIRGETEQ